MMEDNQYIIDKELEHGEFERFWNRLMNWIIAIFITSITFLTIVILVRVFL